MKTAASLELKLFGPGLGASSKAIFMRILLDFRSFRNGLGVREDLLVELFCGQLGSIFNPLPLEEKCLLFCWVMLTARKYLEVSGEKNFTDKALIFKQIEFVNAEIEQTQKKIKHDWARDLEISGIAPELQLKHLESYLTNWLKPQIEWANRQDVDHVRKVLWELCDLLPLPTQMKGRKIRIFNPSMKNIKIPNNSGTKKYAFSVAKFCMNLFYAHGVHISETSLNYQITGYKRERNKSHASLDALKSTTTPSFGIEAQ